MADTFIGRSEALSTDGLAAASERLAIGTAEIWTVLTVETNGCGFMADRRPPILFERHIFSRLTGGRFDGSDVSDPRAGGYCATGAHQYDRLAAALALDRAAAMKSASWGMPQILGQNCAAAGFDCVESMVAAMCDSEDNQLAAFVEFLRTNRLHLDLQSHDWARFARGYNGPGYLVNCYDTKLAAAYQKFSTSPQPDLSVRTAQLYLTFAGGIPGAVDGVMGVQTRNALEAFQRAKGLTVTGAADADTLAVLRNSVGRFAVDA
jgi:hypothetical protein